MALRSAFNLPLGAARLGSWSRISASVINENRTFAALADKDERSNKQVSFSSNVARPENAGLIGRMRPSSLIGKNTLGFSASPFQVQKRTLYNAMTPAQRYFVEGEHVVQAEANRDILFTQLDSNSYLPVLHYVLVGTALGVVFLVLPLLIAPARVDLDKISAYECGFDAFGEARETFSVSFYIVSIMYLLFDIEVVYLIPYVMTNATEYMYWVMQTFVAILVGGFFYEWRMGALEWRE